MNKEMNKDMNKQMNRDTETDSNNKLSDKRSAKCKHSEERKALREERKRDLENYRQRRRENVIWFLMNFFDRLSWKNLDKTERAGRIFRDCMIILAAAVSSVLYYFCFAAGLSFTILPAILFSAYLIPVAFIIVLYGFDGGIGSFTILLIAALIMQPSNVYLLFLHLVLIYCVWIVRKNRKCITWGSTIICSIVMGLILSGTYYSVFVMVGRASFRGMNVLPVLFHTGSVLPQSFLICIFLHLFRTVFSDKTKIRLGVIDRDIDFKSEFISLRKGKKQAGISEKLFIVLLIEAAVLGVAAAGFANSLIPDLSDVISYANPESSALLKEQDNADLEIYAANDDVPESDDAPKYDNNAIEMANHFLDDFGIDETYAIARIDGQRDRFKYNEQGVSFDLKLIMMLLCAIHPIVIFANALVQLMFVKPVEQMTGVMKGFSSDPESRIKTGHELANLGIRTGDEIEELFGALYDTVRELNGYIDKIKEEQQLREDLRVAKAASEAKSNFLSNVSHEIRTPINAVLGLDEMIIRESSEKQIKKYAADIKNSGKTLLALINDLLDFSKIEAGKMDIIPVEYELSSVINDLINMVSSKAAEKGLQLKVDVAKDIPHVLYGDEIRVKQCILNILNNAVKYTHEGSVTLRLTGRRISEEEVALRVNVIDTGIGIKEEDLSKLFSPFERIEESRNRTIEGTGLGMSIVKQLLDMMGSRLEVKSVYGEGSDFSFEVVQKIVNDEPIGNFNETYEKSLENADAYAVSFKAPEAKILVVDDTPMNLTVIKGLLKETEVVTDTATSGFQCIELIKKNKYDIIFMDQRMPEMDGTETLGRIKAMTDAENASFGAPVICLTANVVSGAREIFLKAGFADYLSKPINAVKLEKMIASYLPKEKVRILSEEEKEAIREAEREKTENSQGEGSVDTAEASELEKFMRSAPGLDYDAALKNCMKEDILKEALHDYYVALENGPDKIEGFMRDKDIRNYTVTVHALKSSSRLIGALELSELAAHLEKCGDEGDMESIEKETPVLLEKYRAYRGILSPLYENADENKEDAPIISDEALAEAYMGIKEAAQAFDFDTADEIVLMLKDYSFPDDKKERFEKVCSLVTSLDRDALLELL